MPHPADSLARRLLAAPAAAVLIAGCGSEQEQPTPAGEGPPPQTEQPAGETPEREPDQIYTVRGEIRQLPSPDNPAAGLQIRHEQIPDFVNREGEVVGMRPMIMQFTPSPDLDLGALSVGEKISFTFDVDWDGSPLFMVTKIEPLSPETELDFTAPAPSGG